VYREMAESLRGALTLPEPPQPAPNDSVTQAQGQLLHPKYHLPSHCFGYVGNATDHASWKLPYLFEDGSVDTKRLPKAVGAILSNYRGAKVSGIPENAIPDVLVRLARAAASVGKLPSQGPDTAPIYEQLVEVLEQLGRVEELHLPGH
jgi:hypothetical protein